MIKIAIYTSIVVAVLAIFGGCCLAQDSPESVIRLPESGFPPDAPGKFFPPGTRPATSPLPGSKSQDERTNYGKIVEQSFIMLGVEHGFRLWVEEKTREQLSGPFFRDWFESVETLSGWSDGGSIFSNWICHPAQGSVSAFVFAQNHPQSRTAKFGGNKPYVHAKLKQLIFAAIYSTQFEIGPISECSIGNLGQKFGPEPWQQRGKQAYVDLVVTPIIGTAFSAAEDYLDQKYLRPMLENHRYTGKILCVFINPTRSIANAFAFHLPWYRK